MLKHPVWYVFCGVLVVVATIGIGSFVVANTGISDPVTPAEMAAGEASCAPHGGVTTLSVRRRGATSDLTVQCKDGAVTQFAPKPATKTYHRT